MNNRVFIYFFVSSLCLEKLIGICKYHHIKVQVIFKTPCLLVLEYLLLLFFMDDTKHFILEFLTNPYLVLAYNYLQLSDLFSPKISSNSIFFVAIRLLVYPFFCAFKTYQLAETFFSAIVMLFYDE